MRRGPGERLPAEHGHGSTRSAGRPARASGSTAASRPARWSARTTTRWSPRSSPTRPTPGRGRPPPGRGAARRRCCSARSTNRDQLDRADGPHRGRRRRRRRLRHRVARPPPVARRSAPDLRSSPPRRWPSPTAGVGRPRRCCAGDPGRVAQQPDASRRSSASASHVVALPPRPRRRGASTSPSTAIPWSRPRTSTDDRRATTGRAARSPRCSRRTARCASTSPPRYPSTRRGRPRRLARRADARQRCCACSSTSATQVVAGQALLTMEAMKMEHTVVAPAAGTVAEVLVPPGQQLDSGQTAREDRVVSDGPRGTRPIRIANCSGFYGDRISAAREMVEGVLARPIDVLTGDWLAELTMLILRKAAAAQRRGRLRRHVPDPDGAGARHVRRPRHQGRHQRRRAQPGRLRRARSATSATRLGLDGQRRPRRGRRPARPHRRPAAAAAPTSTPAQPFTATAVSANAYLGGWGIARALAGGADVVVCPRVTDAAVVVGPAAWWWDWAVDDWDRARRRRRRRPRHRVRRADAPAATTRSSTSSPSLAKPLGFPIAEIDRDGNIGDHQAPRHRRASSTSARSPPSCSTRSGPPAYAQPRRDHPLRHDPGQRGRPRPGALVGTSRLAGAGRRPRSASTTRAATATG